MTNERIWQSLVNFLSGLGGTDPVSMIHDTPSYIDAVENYLASEESRVDLSKTGFYLGVFLGEYLNQKFSGYWKHLEEESVVILGPDEEGLLYKTSPNQISIEKNTDDSNIVVNPFSLAKKYLKKSSDKRISAYVINYIQSKA